MIDSLRSWPSCLFDGGNYCDRFDGCDDCDDFDGNDDCDGSDDMITTVCFSYAATGSWLNSANELIGLHLGST